MRYHGGGCYPPSQHLKNTKQDATIMRKEGEYDMISMEDIQRKCKQLGLICYETDNDICEEASVKLCSLDDFLSFVKNSHTSIVFYHYDYADAESLQITQEVLEDLHIDDDVLEVAQDDLDEYNRSVNQLDFSQPYALTVYCIFQGVVVFFDEYNYWFREKGFDIPKKVAISIINSKFEEIKNKKKVSDDLREEKREQLKQKILADARFQKCTNIQLRRAYTQRLAEEDKTVMKLFYSPKHGIYDIPIGTFIEEVWREYKASH